MAKVLKTTVSYLSGETDDEYALERVSAGNIERLVKSTSMVMYYTGNERMLIPATKEGFDFTERMRSERKAYEVTGEKEE